MIQTIAVAGAGTMGSGIALVAAQSNHPTILFDLDKGILEKATASIKKNLLHLTDKQAISLEENEQIFKRIVFTNNISDCKADLIIEAIVEKAAPKIDLFNQLATINTPTTIFATNTSSLSVTEIQSAIAYPQRVLGMHFFNPAPVMKLIEVVKGHETDDTTVQHIYDLCIRMKKMPVICNNALPPCLQ